MRQWRTRLIEDNENESILKSSDYLLNEAALNILNNVIDYLSRPESRPLQRKRVRSIEKEQVPILNKVKLKSDNMKVLKKSGSELALMSKRQRKKLRKMLLRSKSSANSFEEGKVPEVKKFEVLKPVVQCPLPLRLDNQRMVKEKGNDIICKLKKQKNKKKKRK